MARIKENAPGLTGPGALGRTERGGDRLMPYLTTECPPCQADLARLLDQALTLAEKHEADAWRSWQLARKHRQIKAALEGLAGVRA